MLGSRCQHYLQAMGITIWQARNRTVATALDDLEDNPHTTTRHATELASSAQPRRQAKIKQWLIWLGEPSARQQWSAIIQDLQTLCETALAGQQTTPVISVQPEALSSSTAVLGIGLSENQLTALRAAGCHCVNLPAVSQWHNVATSKQQIWHTLQEALWSP